MRWSARVRLGGCLAAWIVWGLASGAGAVQTLVIDVPSVELTGAFLMNGAPFPEPPPPQSPDVAQLSLAGPDGEQLVLGPSTDASYGPLMVVPGIYESFYDYPSGGTPSQIPVNGLTRVGEGFTLAAGVSVVDVDVPAVSVEFEFTVDGAPPILGAFDSAGIVLRHVESGEEIWVGYLDDPTAIVRIVAGDYDVVYQHYQGTALPQNSQAVVAAGVLLAVDQTLVVDVPTVTQFFSFLLNGQSFPSSMDSDGELRLNDFETGDMVSLGKSSVTGPVERTIVPGTYDVTWTGDSGDTLVPLNTNGVVSTDLDLTAPAAHVIDVQAVTLTPDPTIDGAPIPTSMTPYGLLFLVGPQGEELLFAELGNISPGAVFVVAGQYDVNYRAALTQGIAPLNPNARIASTLSLQIDQTVQVDIPTVEISPIFQVDGGSFPTALEGATFTLVGDGQGDTIPLGSTLAPLSTIRIIPGSYDVFYDYENSGAPPTLPQLYAHRVLGDVALQSTQPLLIDVQTELIDPVFLLNSMSFPTDPLENALFHLVQPGSGGSVYLGESNPFSGSNPSVLVIEGTYAVKYRWSQGSQIPGNQNTTVALVGVPEPRAVSALVAGALVLFALAKVRGFGRRSD